MNFNVIQPSPDILESFGDKLYNEISSQRMLIFAQGELAQLTYQAYSKYVEWIRSVPDETIQVTYPIGFNPDRTTIDNTQDYLKQDLVDRYIFLGHTQMPLNGIYQLLLLLKHYWETFYWKR